MDQRRFGMWSIVNEVRGLGRKSFLCKCDCGTEKVVVYRYMVNGLSTNCGCIRNMKVKFLNRTHGIKRDNIYCVWNSMKQRCFNAEDTNFHNYGGRGISVCKEWLDYPVFRSFLLANGYKKGLNLDRINNDGNYEPSNCRVVTPKMNARNKRTNRFIEIEGRKMTLAEWEETTGVNRATIRSRIISGKTGKQLIKGVNI